MGSEQVYGAEPAGPWELRLERDAPLLKLEVLVWRPNARYEDRQPLQNFRRVSQWAYFIRSF